ncbi:MAG TPA: ribokinase [Trueperaceae bacterium]|nr:ribokinase [Trueperaceae bacterium]
MTTPQATARPAAGIAVVGSVNMDLVVRLARHPRPGETVMGSDYATHPGGKGANQAVAASRLGGRVSFVGRVGNDEYGVQLTAALQRDHVDTTALARSGRPSGVAFIQVDEAGQNSIVVSPGANYDLSVADLATPAGRYAVEGAAVLLLQLEVPLEVTLAAAAAGRRAGAVVVLNLAPAQQLDVSALANVGVLLVNETEAVIQLGAAAADQRPAEWAAALCRYAPSAVVTLGGEGAVWATRRDPANADSAVDHGHVPAFPVTVVDTTAAGDAFAGALGYFLARERSTGREGAALAAAVRFASAAGAMATTRAGAQPSLPSLAEVEALLATGGAA